MPTSEQRIIPPARKRTMRDNLISGLKWSIAALFLAYLYASFVRTEFNLYELYSGGSKVKQTLYEIVHPDLSWYEYEPEMQEIVIGEGTDSERTVLKPLLDDSGNPVYKTDPATGKRINKIDPRTKKPKWGTVPELLDLMNETVMISLVGTLISVLISFPLAFGAARNLTRGSAIGVSLYWAIRLVFNILRAFPPIILAIIFVMIVGTGPFSGVMALALHSIGMLGKLFSESIEAVDYAPVEAVKATGANNFLTVWYGILPQVVPQFIAFSLYRWDINIRMSIILGIVGAGGIGYSLDQYIRMFKYSEASTAFLIILVAVTFLDWASGYFREKLG